PRRSRPSSSPGSAWSSPRSRPTSWRPRLPPSSPVDRPWWSPLPLLRGPPSVALPRRMRKVVVHRLRPGYASGRGDVPAREGLELGLRDALPVTEVELVARGQRVQDHAADHHRAMALDLPRVRLGAGAIDDGHAPAADHLHDAVGPDDAGGVLVD